MRKLRKALPHLGLMLYEHQTEPLLKRLRDGEIDLGILALPAAHDGLESRELYEEAFTVALPNDHPLAAKSTIKVQDLKGHTLLLLEDGHCLRDQALEVCSRVDVAEAEDFRATSLETLRQMVVGRARHDAAAGIRRRPAVRLAARAHHAPVRQAGPVAHRGRGVAQIEHADRGHLRGVRHAGAGRVRQTLKRRGAGMNRGSAGTMPIPAAALSRNWTKFALRYGAFADYFTYCGPRTRQYDRPLGLPAMNARTAIAASEPVGRTPPRFDAKFIEDHKLIERYLENKLPFKGARDLENWCRAHPEYLNDLKLAERAQASLKLLEASGQPQDLREPKPPWWKIPVRAHRPGRGRAVRAWSHSGRCSASITLLRGELEDTRDRT